MPWRALWLRSLEIVQSGRWRVFLNSHQIRLLLKSFFVLFCFFFKWKKISTWVEDYDAPWRLDADLVLCHGWCRELTWRSPCAVPNAKTKLKKALRSSPVSVRAALFTFCWTCLKVQCREKRTKTCRHRIRKRNSKINITKGTGPKKRQLEMEMLKFLKFSIFCGCARRELKASTTIQR